MIDTAETTYDVVLTGGRVIDPARGIDAVLDVAIRGGKIAAVEPAIRVPTGAREVIVDGGIVTPGLIDTHAHVYEHVTGDFGLNPDLVGIRSGVPVVVDQGGASALTFDGFRNYVAQPAKSRVLSFISAYLAGGLLGHRYVEMYGPSGINASAIVATARKNLDLVRGVKAHAEPGSYSRWGLDAFRLAKEAARELGLPIYVHLGTLWPEKSGSSVDAERIVRELIPLLDAGDVLAHPFTRYPSGFVDSYGNVHPLVFEALEKGVRIDVGRGSHLSYENARAVLAAGILPFTLGADLHGYNVRFLDGGRQYRGMFTEGDIMESDDVATPFATPHGLHHTMSELMALGVPLVDLVKMTTCNAAELLGLEAELGTLGVGMPAEISVSRLIEGEFRLLDSNGVALKAERLLHPHLSMRGNEVYMADSPLLEGMIPAAA